MINKSYILGILSCSKNEKETKEDYSLKTNIFTQLLCLSKELTILQY